MIALFLKILFSSSCVFAQTEVTLQPADLPRLVREQNQGYAGHKLFMNAAESRRGHLWKSYLPTLKLQAGQENFQTGRYLQTSQPYGHAEAKINLFRGGKDSLENEIRDRQSDLAHAQAQKDLTDELERARSFYWQLVLNREMLVTYETVLEENEKNLQAANRRIRRGLGAETDKLDFEIQRGQIVEQIESLKHEDILIQIELAAVLGMPPGSRFKTAERIPHDHDDPLFNKIKDAKSHPSYIEADAQKHIYALQRNQKRRFWIPDLDIYGGYYLYTLRDRDYLDDRSRVDTVLGVRLSLDWDFTYLTSDASAAKLQSEGFEMIASHKQLTLEASIQTAKEELKHNHEIIHSSETRLGQVKTYVIKTLDEYNRGVKNSIDVLGAAQRQLEFIKENAERRKEYQLTKGRLLALFGE
jgi:outer membrane protein